MSNHLNFRVQYGVPCQVVYMGLRAGELGLFFVFIFLEIRKIGFVGLLWCDVCETLRFHDAIRRWKGVVEGFWEGLRDKSTACEIFIFMGVLY